MTDKAINRQEQIDKIAQWMGWAKLRVFEDTEAHTFHKYLTTTPLPPWIVRVWIWDDAEGNIKAKVDSFDPFTNPSDCARVMDEVVKRDLEISIRYDPPYKMWRVFIGEVDTELKGYQHPSWMEAFCLALPEAIKGENNGK